MSRASCRCGGALVTGGVDAPPVMGVELLGSAVSVAIPPIDYRRVTWTPSLNRLS
jgi:hypothetical protein